MPARRRSSRTARTPGTQLIERAADVVAKVTGWKKKAPAPERNPFERERGEDMQTPLRNAVVLCGMMLLTAHGTKLAQGAFAKLDQRFPAANLEERAVRRLMGEARARGPADDGTYDMSRKRKGRMPTKGSHKFTVQAAKKLIDIDQEFNGRLRYRQLAKKMTAAGCPICANTARKWTKRLGSKMTRRKIKPLLKSKHKFDRLHWVMSNEIVEGADGTKSFTNFHDTAHGDESWIWLMADGTLCRVYPNRDGTFTMPEPPRVRHKSHIPKVMFLVVNARPRPEYNFDGKIGIWEFSEIVHTRNGDEKVLNISVNADVYRAKIVSKGGVFEAMRAKMWWFHKDATMPDGSATPEAGQPLYYQHDGARPHTAKKNTQVWATHGAMKGFDIRVVTQPAQSPDLNINDLCFFRSLKSRLAGHTYSDLVSMLAAAKAAYQEYDGDTLERAWRVLHTVYRGILRTGGDNTYQLSGNTRKGWRHGLDADNALPPREVMEAAQKRFEELGTELGRDTEGLVDLVSDDEEESDDEDARDSEQESSEDELSDSDEEEDGASPVPKRSRRS